MRSVSILRATLLATIAPFFASCANFILPTQQTAEIPHAPTPAPYISPIAPQPLKAIPRSAEIAEPAGQLNDGFPADEMIVHFIDVGQGDAELLEFSCAAVLIDTGGEKTHEVDGRQNLVDYLEAFFERRPSLAHTLKLVVLSHPHIDHTYGVGDREREEGLLGMNPRITVENVVDDGDAPDGATGKAGQDTLKAGMPTNHYFGVTVDEIKSTAGLTNKVIDPVDCSSQPGGKHPLITALWGRVDSSAGSWTKNENNNSVVIKVQFDGASFLFMGDLEQPGIAAMLDSYSADTSIFHAEVLKVGHHGSKNGTTEDLLKVVRPQVAVIGAGNSKLSHATYSAYSYAHPNKVAIDLLLDGSYGVTDSRASKKVTVGIKGADHVNDLPPTFETITLNRAIYATGWDGTVDVVAKANGTLTVHTNH
jgi:competence protein ComEC